MLATVTGRPAEYLLYRVSRNQTTSLPLQMDIGTGDLRWRGQGFHAAEQMRDASVRWTNGRGSLGSAHLILRLAAPRLADWPGVELSVRLHDRIDGAVSPVSSGFSTFTLELDGATLDRLASGQSTIERLSPTFVPRAVGLGDDPRELGVVVDWVRIEG